MYLPVQSEARVGSLRIEATKGYEPSDVGAESQIQIQVQGSELEEWLSQAC